MRPGLVFMRFSGFHFHHFFMLLIFINHLDGSQSAIVCIISVNIKQFGAFHKSTVHYSFKN